MKYLLVDSSDPKIQDKSMQEYLAEYNFWNDLRLFSAFKNNA